MTRRGLLLCLLLSCFSFLLWGTADAKAITVDAKGEYLLTLDVDSPTVAREKAREQARRNATEMGGVYVKAYSETEKLALTKDKVTMLTGSILEIIAEKFSMEPINDNTINVVCHIKANIDTDKINPEKLLQQEEQLQKIAEQNKRIQELEREAELIKKQNAELLKSAQNQEIKERLNENQRQFLIAKYERDIDIYDFGNAKNLQERMDLAQKLIAIDPQNKEAFRCMAAYFRQQNDIPGLMNYCQKTLNNSPSTNLMIEAYTQLGDIYYNERNDKAQSLSYINKGIALVKQNYTPAEIEDMVNGGNVMIKMLELTGRTNVVRELYVLKSDIEGYIPHFESLTIVKEEQLEDDKIFNIRYKTNWASNAISSKGKYNVSGDVITVQGLACFAPANCLIPKTFARQAALLECYRQLGETTFGSHLEENIANKTIHSHNTYDFGQLNSLKLHSIKYLKDGGKQGCEISLDANFDELAEKRKRSLSKS